MIKLRVKEILKNKGITQKDFADKLGITEVGLSKSLGDKGNPTLDTLQKLADALEVEVHELFEKKESGNLYCPHCGKEIHVKIV